MGHDVTEGDIREALELLFAAPDELVLKSLIAMGWSPTVDATNDVSGCPATRCKPIHEWKANDLAGITRGDRWW